MDQREQTSRPIEAPHSIAQAKIDEKGRLKLPAESFEWCKQSDVAKVFVTTFDKKTIGIYPIPVWNSTVIALEAPGEDADDRAGLLRIAKYYGRDGEIDSQGRVVIHSDLRTLMALGSEPVCLEHLKGRIDFTKKTVHDALLLEAEENLARKNGILRKLGL
jgi:MraZ protein